MNDRNDHRQYVPLPTTVARHLCLRSEGTRRHAIESVNSTENGATQGDLAIFSLRGQGSARAHPSSLDRGHTVRSVLRCVGLGLSALLIPTSGWAAQIDVSPNTPPRINADGRCSLIEAITNANRNDAAQADCAPGKGADVIVLPAGSVQELTAVDNTSFGVTGLPVIASDITIQGNGSRVRRNSSAPAFRLMVVTGDLTLTDITLQGGSQPSWDAGSGVRNGGCGILISKGNVNITRGSFLDNSCYYRGGAIYNHSGMLSITDSVLTRNTGQTGGALAQYHGTAEINRTFITYNLATSYDGGGIYNGASVLRLNNSNVSNNGANYGGGIRQEWDSQATISDSTIANNYAKSSGGGVENGAFSTLTIFRSTISGNASDGGGGGLTGTMAHNGTMVVSTTISGNTARTSGGGVLIWGEGVTNLTRSTIAFNHADSNGGGVQISNSPTVFSNTVVTGNTTNGSGPEIACTGGNCWRYALVNHFNLFGHDGRPGLSGVSPGSRDIVPSQPTAAILDTVLSNNGGPTATHALVPGSAAIDKGDPDYEKVIYGRNDIYDQRGLGFPRLSGLHMDIGAFEAQP